MGKAPALFLCHSTPIFAIEENATTEFWERLSQLLPEQPKMLLCISAHWETETPQLSDSRTIQHDFRGFPEELYHIGWRLPENGEQTAWLLERLQAQGIDIRQPAERPLDHGVWVPLKRAWPTPPFPVLQLSVCPEKGCAWHVELGRRLAPLRDEGVLIVTSGVITHNLHRLEWQAEDNEPADWAAHFMHAVAAAVKRHDIEALCDPWQLPDGEQAVPTLEHYLPLLVLMGLAGEETPRLLHEGWRYGTLALHSYGVGMTQP